MITIVEGDLFAQNLSNKRIIVHGCNAQGVMGSGVAKVIKDTYPEAFLDYMAEYRKWKRHHKQMPIGINIVSVINDTIVINAVTQQNYGRDSEIQYVSYDAVDTCLRHVYELGEFYSLPIHMPFIGGGLGNGDKDVLMSIFESTVGNSTFGTTLFIK